jgi:hypothetical protein
MLAGMRSPVLALLLSAAACRASATVERTMPVANLQTFHTIAVRVRNSTFASQGTTIALERQVLERLGRACQFDHVERASGQPADILLDLTIVASGRGGGGFITNNNIATVDTQLVLTDTHDNQLLGTAKIRGKSGGVLVNNNIPEFDAVDKVAEATANLLAKSGCAGPRIARVEPPPPPDTGSDAGSDSGTPDTGTPDTGTGTDAPPPNAHLAEAEAINDQGKEKLYAGDLQGALALFQRANSTAPDARFAFNVCIVQIQLEQWAAANASCQQAKALKPPATLATKIDNRIEQLAQRK